MKHLSLSILIRLLVIVFLGFVLTNETVSIFSLHNEAANLSAEAATLSGTDIETRNLQNIETESVTDIARVDASAVSKADLASVITLIEDAGKSVGVAVVISSVAPGSSAANTMSTVRMSAEATGSWAANLAFQHLLENLPYKLTVDESKLAYVDKTWKSNVTMTLTILP